MENFKKNLLKIIQVDMKLEIQRVNQKINKIEELMTNFLEQISTNNLQVIQLPQQPTQVEGDWYIHN